MSKNLKTLGRFISPFYKSYFSAGVVLALIVLFLTSSHATRNEHVEMCVDGSVASGYDCNRVNFYSVVNLAESGIASESGSDVWGWTDPQTQREYAIMGLDNKTSVVDVTDPLAPVHIGDLPTHTTAIIWRDIKIYQNYAFIVSEAWDHGLQVLDLTKVRNVNLENGPVVFEEDAHYGLFGSAHNIFINEETAYAYVVGSDTCDAGMHVINISNPLHPVFSTCVDKSIFEPDLIRDPDQQARHGEDYTHDVQCVIYRGPDLEHQGREICLASNEDTVNIVDVTDKAQPFQLSGKGYEEIGYTHQGWLTEDHRYFLLGDELDEMNQGINTRTIIWDVSDLDNPVVIGEHLGPTTAIDHNMYVKGQYVYQANYEAGLSILSLENIAEGELKQVAFFDTYPDATSANFNGSWSVFPYFESGTVVMSNIGGKLFVLRPNVE